MNQLPPQEMGNLLADTDKAVRSLEPWADKLPIGLWFLLNTAVINLRQLAAAIRRWQGAA
jgi:hypothetical protein